MLATGDAHSMLEDDHDLEPKKKKSRFGNEPRERVCQDDDQWEGRLDAPMIMYDDAPTQKSW